MKLTIIDNFLTKDELKLTEEYFKKPIWQFGHGTQSSKSSPEKWFYASLNDLPFFTEYLKEKIEKNNESKYYIQTVYANGQTVMNGGSWHVDVETAMDVKTPEFVTALLYVSNINRDNIEKIKGYVDFKLNGEVVSIEPFQNRLVLFDSKVTHRGNAPNIPGFLRISVAWKLIKI